MPALHCPPAVCWVLPVLPTRPLPLRSLTLCSRCPLPSVCSIWERERAAVLRERQEKADAEKQQQLTVAREEIAKFYADADAKLEKTKKVNRADEKNYRADTAAVFANGTKWSASSTSTHGSQTQTHAHTHSAR